jgi:hypothetical protein
LSKNIQLACVNGTGNLTLTPSTVGANYSFGYNTSGGNVLVTSTTASSSTTTGALVVSGGFGVAGKTYLGNDIDINGDLIFRDGSYHKMVIDGGNSNGYIQTDFTGLGDSVNMMYNQYYNAGTASWVIPNAGGGTSRIIYGFGTLTFQTGDANVVASTRASIDRTSFTVDLATESTSTSTGSIKTAGGIGAIKNIRSGGLVAGVTMQCSTAPSNANDVVRYTDITTLSAGVSGNWGIYGSDTLYFLKVGRLVTVGGGGFLSAVAGPMSVNFSVAVDSSFIPRDIGVQHPVLIYSGSSVDDVSYFSFITAGGLYYLWARFPSTATIALRPFEITYISAS